MSTNDGRRRVELLHCVRCDYWWPSSPRFRALGRKPKVCPRCKSRKWHQPTVRTLAATDPEYARRANLRQKVGRKMRGLRGRYEAHGDERFKLAAEALADWLKRSPLPSGRSNA